MKAASKCDRCGVKLRKRKRPPRTATNDGHLYFGYYQCPKCKTNVASPKQEQKK